MNRDDVLEMARKAGFCVTLIKSIEGDEVIGQGDNGVIVTDELERFAALVAERTREECARVRDGELGNCLAYRMLIAAGGVKP